MLGVNKVANPHKAVACEVGALRALVESAFLDGYRKGYDKCREHAGQLREWAYDDMLKKANDRDVAADEYISNHKSPLLQ